MPRKAYLNDLASVSALPDYDENIFNIRPGGDDGEFVLSFVLRQSNLVVDISVMIPDVSEYPTSHDYHIFAADDAPAIVAAVLLDVPSCRRKSVPSLLSTLSKFLADKTRTGGPSDPFQIVDSGDDVEYYSAEDVGEVEEESDEYDGENEDWALDDAMDANANFGDTMKTQAPQKAALSDTRFDFASRGRSDLHAVKGAGFKVGVHGGLQPGNTCYVSISCRIAKLGISEEAMAAWSIQPEQYLILILCYKTGYKSMEFLQNMDTHTARQHFEMRSGISNTYKARSALEARQAFVPSRDGAAEKSFDESAAGETDGFRQSIISRPVDELLNGRFLTIFKYRLSRKCSWATAELYYEANQGKERKNSENQPVAEKTEELPAALPSLVTEDELEKSKDPRALSLPLVAMQFHLRHFVSAPSFCLVCHCKVVSRLEAIKPYVCDKSLCLYQYMTLGFGPAIEHELLVQPYVVDLLVSFCYSSVKASTLNAFPEGLGLMVPDPALTLNKWVATIGNSQPNRLANAFMSAIGPPQPTPNKPKSQKKESPKTEAPPSNCYEAKINQQTLELLFDSSTAISCPVQVGDWIVVNCTETSAWHCRIVETRFFPTITLAEPLVCSVSGPGAPGGRPVVSNTDDVRSASWQNVNLHIYDTNFDDLTNHQRYQSLQLLLDLMPGVNEMREYLTKKRGVPLSSWTDKMCPATLSLLRWIIASNRSCIMQVDRLSPKKAGSETNLGEQRIEEVPDWLQFRFAMGAPDKEQRFVDAIKSVNSNAQYPTLFAWHGSALENWHNIVRESLNFKRTVNGRAYGHGVYFARDFNTSSGYAGAGIHNMGAYVGSTAWPHSMLQISNALALAEIVNAPAKFVSQAPYYVVAQLEWIQTRYLFVKPSVTVQITDHKLASILEQDPARTPLGSTNRPIILPITAVPKSRRPIKASDIATDPPKKKVKLTAKALAKLSRKSLAIATVVADDSASVDTDPEDLELLFEPPAPLLSPPLTLQTNSRSISSTVAVTTTPFTAGTITNLPTMPVPSYATSQATKRLQKDFRTLLATQTSHLDAGKLSELGWYVDPEHISRTDNLYQWVVELHSFPKELPLAMDFIDNKIQSVVLEIRFHATYPMSPPFVRVVRPRFLPFQQGGGGHVTAGGSICMDLLTNSGWSVVSSMESVLMQIRLAIMSTDPRPARLDLPGRSSGVSTDYGVGEAVEAFKRACRTHGWVVPPGLDDVMSNR